MMMASTVIKVKNIGWYEKHPTIINSICQE